MKKNKLNKIFEKVDSYIYKEVKRGNIVTLHTRPKVKAYLGIYLEHYWKEDGMKIEYKDLTGKVKTITLNAKDKEGDHWHINEEPFIVYEREIIDGKFSSNLHNKYQEALYNFQHLLGFDEPSSFGHKLSICYRKVMNAYHKRKF